MIIARPEGVNSVMLLRDSEGWNGGCTLFVKNALTWRSHHSSVPFPSEVGIDVDLFFHSPDIFGAVITGLRRGLGVIFLSISAKSVDHGLILM